MSHLPAARHFAAAIAVAALLAGCAPDALAPQAVPAPAVDHPPVAVATTPAVRVARNQPRPTPSSLPASAPLAQETRASVPPKTMTPSTIPTTAAPSPTSAPPTTRTPEPPAAPAPLMEPGDDTAQVRELQHRLLQLNWFEGKISSLYGDATRLAVEGFQAKRGLPATGEVDATTWDRLVAMTRMPTHDEMHNVMVAGPALLATGSTGDKVKDLQARLIQVAWYHGDIDGHFGPKTAEAVAGFQKKRAIPVTGEVDERTLDRLTSMTRKPTTDELNNVMPTPSATPQPAMVLDDRCLQGRVVCISKAQRKLAWVIDGQIQMTVDVRFGSELTPTRNGVFAVNWKSRDHVSSIYDTAMPFALFFSGGQAVHFSADFAARGYNGSSHGCVNVRDKSAAQRLFEATREGDRVVVFAD